MYNVLVADDHAIVRSGISYLVDLQPNFTVVDGTASGTDTYIRVEQGGIDILIMDLSMPPGENGLITTRRIHDKFPKLKLSFSRCTKNRSISIRQWQMAQCLIF